MSKKLMLLAVGALTALAFTALPSLASAGVQWCSHSPRDSQNPAHFTITGGAAELINDANERV